MPFVLHIRKNGRNYGSIGPYDKRVDALADAVTLKRPGHTVTVVPVRRNYAQLVALFLPFVTQIATQMARAQIKAYLALSPQERVKFLRKRAWASPPLRLALANDKAAKEAAQLLTVTLKSGAADIAIDTAALALNARAGKVGLSRRNAGRRNPKAGPWIKHEGKLGGPGFLTKATKAQKTLLTRAVKEWGYRSTLGSLMALERNRQIKESHGVTLAELRQWLVEKHGGAGSFGSRA